MRQLTEFDVKMFFVMDAMKSLSKCRDKQVVCLLVDADETIRSIGINTIKSCNGACEDKAHRICEVVHAEKQALINADYFSAGYMHLKAYVNLFPCAPCQDTLDPYVDEIVTFGMAHKEWKSEKVLLFPHPFYTGRAEQPIKTVEERNISKLLTAQAMYTIGEMTSILQDQHSKHREELSKEVFNLVRNSIRDRFGELKLWSVTKRTYSPS